MTASASSPPLGGVSRTTGISSVAYVHLMMIYVIWGSTYLMVKICLHGAGHILPLHIQFGREGCGALILASLALYRHGLPQRLRWPDLVRCIGTGMLMWAGGNTLATSCAPYASSGFIVMSMGSIPLWCALFDCVVSRTRPSMRVVGALLAGLGGLFMVVWPVLSGHGGISGPHPVLVVMVLQLSAMTWSLGTVLQRPLAGRLAPEWTAAIQMACASCLLAFVLWVRGAPLPDYPAPAQIGAFVYLVIFGGVVAPASYVVVLRTFSPEIASTFAYVNPVVGLLLGWAVLGEQPALLSIAGIVVVLGSVALIMRRS